MKPQFVTSYNNQQLVDYQPTDNWSIDALSVPLKFSVTVPK